MTFVQANQAYRMLDAKEQARFAKLAKDDQTRYQQQLKEYVKFQQSQTKDDESDDSCESIQWVLTAQAMQRQNCEQNDTKIAEMYQALAMQSQMEAFERAKVLQDSDDDASNSCIWL